MEASHRDASRTPTTARNVGRIEEIQGVVIEAVFPDELPEINHAPSRSRPREAEASRHRSLVCEVQQHLGDDRVRAVAMDTTDGLARGTEVVDTGGPITVPGRRRSRSGASSTCSARPIDQGERRSRSRSAGRSTAPRPTVEDLTPTTGDVRDRHQGRRPARALRQGRQGRPVRRRRRRQDGPHPGAHPQPRPGARRPVGLLRRGRALPRGQRPLAGDEGVGRHRQDDARLRPDERAARRAHARRAVRPDDGGVLPRRRARTCCCSSTTSSASCRPARRSPRCSGRMPSQVGYQPTLETEMGQLQERITSTRQGSVTSVQAIYVPADDLTDPAPASVFAHLNATTMLSRSISEKGIYPAVDPLDSTSTILKPDIVGEEHFRVANEVKEILQRYKRAAGHHRDPRHRRALRRGQASPCSARARSSASCRSRSTSPSSSRARRAQYVPIAETVRSLPARSSTASTTTCPSRAFLLKGTIDDVVEAAEEGRASGPHARSPSRS